MIPPSSSGLHHTTAITDDAQRSVDFHVGVLGMRLVKLTVNLDDPSTHHLYFGDDLGLPGSALTYFPWAGMGRGTRGAGEVQAMALAVPHGSVGYWTSRLAASGVRSRISARFGEAVLLFEGPDGMRFEMIEAANLSPFTPARGTDVEAGREVRGLHSATLRSRRPEKTVEVLTGMLGFVVTGVEGDRTRLVAAVGAGGGRAGSAATLDVVAAASGEGLAELGVGSVHHIAVRSSAGDHLKFLEKISAAGYRITPVMERVYFRSLYFREPGGVLLEIATDDPGFGVDESAEALGTGLKLPPWLEGGRGRIEASLPKLLLPGRR